MLFMLLYLDFTLRSVISRCTRSETKSHLRIAFYLRDVIWVILLSLFRLLIFFLSKSSFSKNSFRNAIRMPNTLNPDL